MTRQDSPLLLSSILRDDCHSPETKLEAWDITVGLYREGFVVDGGITGNPLTFISGYYTPFENGTEVMNEDFNLLDSIARGAA